MKMRHFVTVMGVLGLSGLMGTPALAQNSNSSPVLLLESGPSDNPKYRRMVFVKYLQGNSVSANYRAYNRSEFEQMPRTTPAEVVRKCSSGPATSLSDLRKFEREEAKRARNGQPPEVAIFCVKNVPNWQGLGRKTYLDPIFNGMKYADELRN